MLHRSRFALGRLTSPRSAAACLVSVLVALSGCKSGEVGTQRQAAPAAPAVEAAAPAKQVLVPAGTTPGVNVQASANGLVVTNEDGKEAVRVDTTSGKAPENWPSEVPLYPGGKVQMSMQLARGTTLTLETLDALAKVADYYRTQLASMPQSNRIPGGNEAGGETSETLMWSDPSKPLQVTLALSAAQGKTRATLIVTRER